MIADRLGVINDEVSPSLPEALDWMGEQQLKHVELRMVDGANIVNLSDREIGAIKREVDKRGINVAGIASPLFKCALDPSREITSGDRFGQEEATVADHFKILARTIEIARQLETSRIRIFSFWREKRPGLFEDEIVRYLAEAVRIVAGGDILLLLENEGACNGGYAEEVSRLVRKVNAHNLQALWDPGNEVYWGRSAFPEGYAQVKDTLGHVHLKDARIDRDGQPRCVPIGSGQVPYAQQLKALEADGYDGLFIIETHYVPEGGTKMDGTTESLEGLRTLLAQEQLV